MKESIKSLLKNALFNDIDEKELHRILSFARCRVEVYEKDSLVVQEGEYCDTIGFVL